MANICNHTGISICGLNKDHQDHRLFLDDCDMFEYNCDNGKVYLKVDDNLCPQNVTKDINETITTGQTSEITIKTSVTLPSTTTTVKSTINNVTRVPIATECTRSKKTDSSTTVTESPTTGTNMKDIKTTSAEIQRCTCMDTDSTTTTEIPTIKTLTYSESTDSTLPMTKTTQTQSINTSTSTGKSCTCNVPTTESILTTSKVTTTIETTSAKIERCTCMDRDITTNKINPSTTTTTYSESTDTTLPTKTTLTKPIDTSTATGKRCTCNLSNTSTMESISTTPITSTTTTTIKPRTVSKKICTCMDTTTALFTTTTEFTTSPVTTTSTESSKTVIPSSKPGCTCSPHIISSIETTVSSPIYSDESTETTVDYVDVIPTPDGASCKKYPAHCKRPQTWETTVRGETRDFFQILREKFGDRIKILKDTTHFPRRTVKVVEDYNDAFRFGNHNELW
ncbi:unnamed protein product [Danaus chrysippus]|uniref:(African queen) hypothetical protein n=1 Tax=Danaus chrysippus TaxID=151541 RepID=A0A8J2VT83_9NEOP|nr:unnamed protein product [Danaus chrysippus]